MCFMCCLVLFALWSASVAAVSFVQLKLGTCVSPAPETEGVTPRLIMRCQFLDEVMLFCALQKVLVGSKHFLVRSSL